MKGWYKAAADHAPSPARLTLENITEDQFKLYRRVPLTGEDIPIFVEPFQVEDLVPTEEEIDWEVQRL